MENGLPLKNWFVSFVQEQRVFPSAYFPVTFRSLFLNWIRGDPQRAQGGASSCRTFHWLQSHQGSPLSATTLQCLITGLLPSHPFPLPFLTTYLSWILKESHSTLSHLAMLPCLTLLGGEKRGKRRGDSLLSDKTVQVGNRMKKSN